MEGRKKVSNFLSHGKSAAMAISLLAVIGSAHLAHGAEDDLPAPSDGVEQELTPNANPPAQEPFPDFNASEEALPPAPGSSPFPEPSANPGSDSNVVNKADASDDIFLPTPGVQDNVNYAPLGSPVTSRTNFDDNDWRMGMNNRPAFSFGIGGAVRNYVDSRTKNTPGAMISGSWRVINIAQTVFLHAYASASVYRLGDLGPYSAVQDITLHMGGLLEIGIGRRLSLYGSLMRRSNTISATPNSLYPDANQLALVDEPTKMTFGAGVQWDFYVVPHGSLGARVHLEQDIAMFMLTMAIEPAPRKRLTLNYESIDR
jgi:hypothetical protein